MRLDGTVPPLIVAVVAAAVLALGRLALSSRRMRAETIAATGVVILLVLSAGLERAMGRPWTYQHGPVRVWSGDIASDQNSQQMFDPYTVTHVTHGALFYGLACLAAPGAAVATRLLLAIAVETAWEVYENTDEVVERYRATTIALGYYGDSVLNSFWDVIACMVGFWLTARLMWPWAIAWVALGEILLAVWIRDNLTLNILMLIYPLESVRAWQGGL